MAKKKENQEQAFNFQNGLDLIKDIHDSTSKTYRVSLRIFIGALISSIGLIAIVFTQDNILDSLGNAVGGFFTLASAVIGTGCIGAFKELLARNEKKNMVGVIHKNLDSISKSQLSEESKYNEFLTKLIKAIEGVLSKF